MKLFGLFFLVICLMDKPFLQPSASSFLLAVHSRLSPSFNKEGNLLQTSLRFSQGFLYQSRLTIQDFIEKTKLKNSNKVQTRAYAEEPSSQAGPNNKTIHPKQKILIDVPAGAAFYQLAEDLEEKQIISSAKLFKALIWLHGRPALRQGEYEISANMNFWKIFKQFKEGKVRSFKVSFPEGFNHYEMATALKSQNYSDTENFLDLVWDKNFIKKTLDQDLESLEGYLFPDTYYLTKYMPAEELIKSMTEKFFAVYQELNQAPLEFNLNRHQVVTLASIVEKETGRAEERALIAGVFFNRLKKNMKLQTDPSILYSLYLVRGFDIVKNIKKADILFNSPYNTYVVKGLPPNPISNPGQKSLQAVFSPEKSDYLYFVSKNDGSHKFSKTYEEHKKAVYKYQK